MLVAPEARDRDDDGKAEARHERAHELRTDTVCRDTGRRIAQSSLGNGGRGGGAGGNGGRHHTTIRESGERDFIFEMHAPGLVSRTAHCCVRPLTVLPRRSLLCHAAHCSATPRTVLSRRSLFYHAASLSLDVLSRRLLFYRAAHCSAVPLPVLSRRVALARYSIALRRFRSLSTCFRSLFRLFRSLFRLFSVAAGTVWFRSPPPPPTSVMLKRALNSFSSSSSCAWIFRSAASRETSRFMASYMT